MAAESARPWAVVFDLDGGLADSEGAGDGGAEGPRPWAVVFDLGGVLVAPEGGWDGARRDLVAEAGGVWREGATHAMLGMSAPEWSRYVRDELGVPMTPEQIDARVVR